MLMSGFENEKLFAEEVPVLLKNEYTNQKRPGSLFLTVEWKEASMYNRKVLKMTLTNNDDIYFLYNLELSEEDFHTLKTSQQLVIDFISFPENIIKLLKKCLPDEASYQSNHSLTFTYSDKCGHVAVPAQLEIIEKNQFKNITLLSLKFTAATEIALTQYQCARFKNLKETIMQLQKNLDFTENDLSGKLRICQQALHHKDGEMENVKKELNLQLSEKKNEYQRKLQEERERLVNRHKDEIDRLEKEIKAKEYNFRKDIQQFETRVNDLDASNRELQDKNFKHESKIRELKSKVQSLEDEKKRLKDNVQSNKTQNENLKSEIRQKESQMKDQEETIHYLQQELNCKNQSISNLNSQLETVTKQKKLFENKFQDIKYRFDSCEQQRKVLEADKARLNDVIVGLQDSIKDYKKEEKALNHVLARHKKAIDEKERALFDAKQESTELKTALQVKNGEVTNLKDSNHNLLSKIEGLEKDIQEKGKIIKWLQQHLTQNGIIISYTPPSHLVSPSAEVQKQLANISSQRLKNSPPVVTEKSAASKSVRIKATSPAYKQRSSFPPHSHRTAGTDSAYCTASLHSNQNTPEILAGNHKMNTNPTNFEVDPEVLNGAFGNGEHCFKHSTAKKTSKSSKPANSSTPKSSKNR